MRQSYLLVGAIALLVQSGCESTTPDRPAEVPGEPVATSQGPGLVGKAPPDSPPDSPSAEPDPEPASSGTQPLPVDPTPPKNDPPAPTSKGTKKVGEACGAAGECASGQCEGMGCGSDSGKCVGPPRRCTRDLRPYCDCGGKSFMASGSCPGRLYKSRGPCPT